MRRARGFTLIELVIVIVILGILGAVAAPRFINMQRDAYIANLEALKGSVETAVTFGHTKAILNGYDTVGFPKADSNNNFKRDDDNGDVYFAYGYPDASGNGIIKMLQNSGDFSFDNDDSIYVFTHTDDSNTELRISLRGRGYQDVNDDSRKCELTYKQPEEIGEQPKITLYTQGC